MTNNTPKPTATIWISPYRITYRTSDHELTGAIHKTNEGQLLQTLKGLFSFLRNEGYYPLIQYEEH